MQIMKGLKIMKNIFIDRYAKSLKVFFDSQQYNLNRIAENNNRFLPEYAKKYNAILEDAQKAAYQACQQEIFGTFEAVRTLLAKATYPDAKMLNEEDIRLFTSGMSLSPEVIMDRVEKYQSECNFTMLTWIRDWLAKQPQSLETASIQFYFPADILDAYRQFGNLALRNAAKIATPNSPIMRDPLELQLFADEEVHRQAFELIGDGTGLSRYRDVVVSDRILHSFDNVQLQNTDINSIIYQYAL